MKKRTNLLKEIRQILSEVKVVDKDLKELKFWTKITLKEFIWSRKITWINNLYFTVTQVSEFQREFDRFNDIDEVIWNELEFRHLLLYLNAKLDHSCILTNWYLVKVLSNSSLVNTLIKFDLTKSLENQTEEVLEQILNYLNNL